MCTYSPPRVRLVHRPQAAATGRRLHLYYYGRRLSSSVGDAAAVALLPVRPTSGGMRQCRWRQRGRRSGRPRADGGGGERGAATAAADDDGVVAASATA